VTSEREQRQYALMRERVADFRAGRRDIGPVIADLKGLLRALQETSEDWRDRFVEAWSGLEIAYAVALDRGTALPTPADPDVAESLDDLDALIAEVIDV
jgi:hypothetical protein